MSARVTFEEAVAKLCAHPKWSWSARWWRLGELIVATRDKAWSVKDPAKLVPQDVTALGCTGIDQAGRLAWVFWDLDVGHGAPITLSDGEQVQPYATVEEAIADARRLRDALDGHAEIRLSKSGRGVHVRCFIDAERGLPGSAGPEIAKTLARKLKLKADRSPLGRQAAWLWARALPPRAFELIEDCA